MCMQPHAHTCLQPHAHMHQHAYVSAGAMLGCIDPVLTIAAASSLSRPPFLTPFDKRQEANAAHAPFRGEMWDPLF